MVEFGLLNALWEPLEFTGGRIEPILSEEELRKWLVDYESDGFVYAPGNERRAALIWWAQKTHRLVLHNLQGDEARLVNAVVLHSVGWAFDARLQFADWLTDLRIPCKPARSRVARCGGFVDEREDLASFLAMVYSRTQTLDPSDLKKIGALLIQRARIEAYEWHWEKFLHSYLALDLCWRCLLDLKLVKREKDQSHSGRIRTMCSQLGIPDSPDSTKKICKLRNELMHEAIWDGHIPGHGGSLEADSCYFHVRELVDRLIMHILEIDCGFRTSRWDIMAWPLFNLKV